MAPTSYKQGLSAGNPGYDNLDPVLRSIADQIIAMSGGRVWIGSGWRSYQRQSQMYNAWKNGTYKVPRVAPPGRSQHNHGRAIDFGGDLKLAQRLGRQLGLVFPMSDEPWHGQLGGNVRYSGEPNFDDFGIQYNLNGQLGKAASPQDVIANRMSAIMSSLGGNQFGSGAMDSMNPMGELMGIEGPDGMVGGEDQFFTPTVSGTNLQNTQVGMAPGGKKKDLQTYARSLFQQFGFSDEDFPALVQLWNKESGWNPTAQNPTSSAFGIAQFLNGTWRGTGIAKTANPQQQIMAGLMYIKSRYKNPTNALQFHLRHNWY